MHVFECVCMQKFRDEVILRGGACKTHENFKFKFFKKKKKIKKGGAKRYYRNSPEKS